MISLFLSQNGKERFYYNTFNIHLRISFNIHLIAITDPQITFFVLEPLFQLVYCISFSFVKLAFKRDNRCRVLIFEIGYNFFKL